MPPLPRSVQDETVKDTVLALTQRMLDAIGAGDFAAYAALCLPDMTAFEPEALDHQVQGLSFHRFYFESRPASAHAAATPTPTADAVDGTHTDSDAKSPTVPQVPVPARKANTTIVSPVIRVLSQDSTAVSISYVRLTQVPVPPSKPSNAAGSKGSNKAGSSTNTEWLTTAAQETRLWVYVAREGAWKQAHFHRSVLPSKL